jgi:hypothetical protein
MGWLGCLPPVAEVTRHASPGAAPCARGGPWLRGPVALRDLAAVLGLYAAVVALYRLAFVGFTPQRVLGLFLSFAGALLLGVAGPVVYTVWIRRRPLRSLGVGTHNLRPTLVLAVLLGGIQFVIMFWGYTLPAPVGWVPLLVLSLTVGLFEAIFFRGFVQGRLEDSEDVASEAQDPATPQEEQGDVATARVLGMAIAELNDETRAQFGISNSVNGVVITDVAANSPAAEKGIQPGDVITEIAQESVSSPKQAMDRITSLRNQGRRNALLMLSSKDGELRFETVRMN